MNQNYFKVHSILITILIIISFIRFKFSEPNIFQMFLVIGWSVLFFNILKVIFKKKLYFFFILMILPFSY